MNRSFPAQILAETTAPYFAEHAESARRDGEYNIAIPPTAEMIEEITDAAFWASLRREEGYTPRISLAYASPDGGRAIRFDRPLALSSTALTKVAPAVERPGVHLGVWLSNGELCVWGTTRDLPSLCFVLEVIAPGLLIVKHSRAGGSTKYVNVAVLEGDQMKMLGESAAGLVDCPGVHASLLGFSAPGPDEFTSVLVQIAVSMRDHGRGGLLLVVNAGDDWRQSILQPIPYAVTPPFSELAELTADHREDDRTWQDALHRSVAMVGGLTAVDGATILNHK